MSDVREVKIPVEGHGVEVSGILTQPPDATYLYVLAHGAGAGMHHSFMRTVADGLAENRIATLRYQFPYMEAGRPRPDPPARAEATVTAAVQAAANLAPRLKIVAGGKSFGGRMTSQAAAHGKLANVSGLVFLGFPLHAPNKPSSSRADHLDDVLLPMLFVQGTRDALGDLTLLKPIVHTLGPKAKIHVVEGGDHSFVVTKASGRTPDEVMSEITGAIADWTATL